jgi:hypothetical protein
MRKAETLGNPGRVDEVRDLYSTNHLTSIVVTRTVPMPATVVSGCDNNMEAPAGAPTPPGPWPATCKEVLTNGKR